MDLRFSRWAAPAIVTFAALGLAACAGGMSTTPNAQGISQASSVGALGAERPQIANPNVALTGSCPSAYLDCVTVSKSKGLDIIWCFGPSSDPCGDSVSNKYKWSGLVCLAKTSSCKKAIKQLKAKWSGPFKCQAKDKCTGTFELDKLIPGTGLKVTPQYLYKQHIHVCPKGGGSCSDAYIGINVGK